MVPPTRESPTSFWNEKKSLFSLFFLGRSRCCFLLNVVLRFRDPKQTGEKTIRKEKKKKVGRNVRY
jgi:hypothetical protein